METKQSGIDAENSLIVTNIFNTFMPTVNMSFIIKNGNMCIWCSFQLQFHRSNICMEDCVASRLHLIHLLESSRYALVLAFFSPFYLLRNPFNAFDLQYSFHTMELHRCCTCFCCVQAVAWCCCTPLTPHTTAIVSCTVRILACICDVWWCWW